VPLYNFVPRGFGFVHHSLAIIQVPNPNLTIRNFFSPLQASGAETAHTDTHPLEPADHEPVELMLTDDLPRVLAKAQVRLDSTSLQTVGFFLPGRAKAPARVSASPSWSLPFASHHAHLALCV
jgi:hypothetical protein